MKNIEEKEIKKWIKTWETAGPALDKVKLNELRAQDYYSRNQVHLNEMLQYAFEHGKVRLSSGLVEQQQIFMQLKNKIDKTIG